MNVPPTTVEEVQAALCQVPRLLPRAGGSKPALSTPPQGAATLDLSGLAGVLEYEPGEFTFTALAGTPLTDIQELLGENGQHLPFDPPLASHGATLGGTVAAGLSGPGRYRNGGVHDFLLGVRFANSQGQLVRGGGKVVKNAAGFDLPKLMVGSLGQFGVLVELTFKVFPRPEAYLTLRLERAGLDQALQDLYRLTSSQMDIEAIDLEPLARGAVLWVRLGGLANTLPARLDSLRGLLGGGDLLQGDAERAIWHSLREMEWVPAGWSLVKVPLTPGRIPTLEKGLEGVTVERRYSAGGQIGWIALPETPQTLNDLLRAQELSGLAIFGPPGPARLGLHPGESFARRIKSALDPDQRFVEV